MAQKKALQRELERLASKPRIKGADLGRLLLKSYRAVVDHSVEQMDRELFSRQELRVYRDEPEREAYNCYKRLYLDLFPMTNKAKELCRTFTVALNEIVDSLKNFGEEFSERFCSNSVPYVVTQKEYDRITDSAIEHIKGDRRAEFIDEAFSYFLSKGKPQAPKKILNEYNRLADTPISDNLTYKDKGREFTVTLKSSGKEVKGVDDPLYIEELKAKAIEHTGNDNLKEYVDYCSDKKRELLFKGGKAIKDQIEKTTGKRPRIKDSELEAELERLIDSCGPKFIFNDNLIELENALGLLPPLKKKYKASRVDCAFIILPFYEHHMSELEADFPKLYSILNDIAERGDKSEIGDYLLFKFSDPPVKDYYHLERIADSGVAILNHPTREQERGDVINHNVSAYSFVFGDRSNIQKQLSSLYYSIAYINCYNIVADKICDIFKLPSMNDILKIELDYCHFEEDFNRTLALIYKGLSRAFFNEELTKAREKFRETFEELKPLEYFSPTEESIQDIIVELETAYNTNDRAYRFTMLEAYTTLHLLGTVNY